MTWHKVDDNRWSKCGRYGIVRKTLDGRVWYFVTGTGERKAASSLADAKRIANDHAASK